MMQFWTGTPRITPSKSYMLSLTEYEWKFQHDALWDTPFWDRLGIYRNTLVLFLFTSHSYDGYGTHNTGQISAFE